jgi:hypothetical protein
MWMGRKFSLHDEPSLEELLDDPVIQAVMACDRVEREELLDIVVSARARLSDQNPRARDRSSDRREPYLIAPARE